MKNNKKDFENERYEEDIIDVLLDENNCEPIVLEGRNGKRQIFDQIAVIPMDEKLYCVLKPLAPIDGIGDDEAIVFVVHEEDGKEPTLMAERDELIALKVFDEYYDLLDGINAE